MIVCHCNRIDHTQIERACEELCAADPLAVLTPALVYKTLGHRPRCGGCLQLAANLIHTRGIGQRPEVCAHCPMLAVETAANNDTGLPSAVSASRLG